MANLELECTLVNAGIEGFGSQITKYRITTSVIYLAPAPAMEDDEVRLLQETEVIIGSTGRYHERPSSRLSR